MSARIATFLTGQGGRRPWRHFATVLPAVVMALVSFGVAGCADDPLAPSIHEVANVGLEPDAPSHALLADDLATEVRVASGRPYAFHDDLRNGARAYVDRTYVYRNVPSLLSGHAYLRTANGDQRSSGNDSYLSFRLKQQAVVYLAFNGPPPAWVANRGFTPVDQSLVIAKAREENTHQLYSRTYSPGVVTLGSNRGAAGSAMYTVVVKPVLMAARSTSVAAGVVRGERQRGFGAGTYVLATPKPGGTTYYVDQNGRDSNPGTHARPFRTINQAAQVARAGDVVNIRPGTYRESVSVRNAGTATHPIVFQSVGRTSVVLTGGNHNFAPAQYYGGVKQSGAVYVTLRGLVFRNYAPETEDVRRRAAVAAIRGWTIEECLFDAAGYSGLDIRGDSVTVLRSTFENHHTLAISAAAETGARRIHWTTLQDVVLRRNNTRPNPLSGAASTQVIKFYRTAWTTVDNMESYENNGPGLWFDTDNTNYVVRNSYIHDNRGRSGRGLFLEVSKSPGLVENNVFANNEISGVTVANSTGVTVRNNLFVGNGFSLHLVEANRGADYPLRNVTITHNSFKGWKGHSNIHPGGTEISTPGSMNVHVNYNTYDPGAVAELSYWSHTGWLRNIGDMRRKLGWEADGTIGAVSSPI